MSKIKELFSHELKVINIGLEGFYQSLEDQDVDSINLDWQPPAKGDLKLLKVIQDICLYGKTASANQEAMERISRAQPALVGIGKALDTIPGMHSKLFLHAGPPVKWSKMCGPIKGAVIGALIYEGLAEDEKSAQKLASTGEIEFAPCHHYHCVGPMAGLISPSMPVWMIENKTFENKAYCTLNEGLGKVLRYGAYSEEVIAHLKWIEKVLAPNLKLALESKGEIDLKNIIAQALHMADEVHNRNKAATSLFIRTIVPHLVKVCQNTEDLFNILNFMDSNDHFFLNLSMPTCKSILEPAENIPYSSIVTIMARNGTEFGIKISGMPGEWFTSPAGIVEGLYFPGFSELDANPDIGDSTITETCGLGGFAMAGAPAIAKFVGGSPEQAKANTLQMYEITAAENDVFTIPTLDFRGTPTGIDALKVVETNIAPFINTGIAHKDAGIGQIGAGILRAPIECFQKAVMKLAEQVKL